MMKYNFKMITDYINGDDIEGYEVEDLENDSEFMRYVMQISKDSKMYHYCSEDVKLNYGFVLFYVKTFSNDIDYICQAADYYLDNSNDEINKLELSIVMEELTRKKNWSKNIDYAIKRAVDAKYEDIEISVVKASLEEDKEYITLDSIGLGFIVTFEKYKSSKIVTDFFAKKYLDLIFNSEEINYEEFIHQRFSNPESLTKIGINNFLLKIIAYHDSFLSDYVSTNLELLDDLKKELEKIVARWNEYNEKIEDDKYSIAVDLINRYLYEVVLDSLYTNDEMVLYIARELGVIDKIIHYDNPLYEAYKDREYKKFDLNKLTVSDHRHYINVKKIMHQIIIKGEYQNMDSYTYTEEDAINDIIKLKK